jgi:hypothetical protein
MAAGIEASKRIEEKMAATRAINPISDEKAVARLRGTDRRGGLFEGGFDAAMGAGAFDKLEDRLADIAKSAVAGGGRRNLAAGMRQQQDVLEGQRQAIMERNDLTKGQKAFAMSFIDEELGKLADALSQFSDLAYQDAKVLEDATRTLFSVGDVLDRGKSSISRAFGERASASRIQSEMNDLSDVSKAITQMMADAVKNGEDPSAFKADADAVKQMSLKLAAAADNVGRFAMAITDATKTVEQDFGSFGSRFSEARQTALLLDNPAATGRADAARNDLEAARKRKRDIEDRVAGAIEVTEAEANRMGNPRSARIAEINRQLAVPMDTVAGGINGGTAAERSKLRAERADLEDWIREGQRNLPEVKAAQAEADDMSRQAIMAAAADRGRILGLSSTAKAREEMDAKIADIGARASDLNGNEKFGFVQQAMSNMAKEVAPLLAQFGEEVRNAQLAGPNRAALNASDVTTMQGQSELSRLLRGDDPSKDVNFVELQKQTTLLQELPQKLAEATGIVLDFK